MQNFASVVERGADEYDARVEELAETVQSVDKLRGGFGDELMVANEVGRRAEFFEEREGGEDIGDGHPFHSRVRDRACLCVR